MSAWTSRLVEFDPDPRHKKEQFEGPWDDLFTALADYFYRDGARYTPAISSCEGVIHVDGFPRYVTRRRALRLVTGLAEKSGVGGVATFRVERSVLLQESPQTPPPSAPGKGAE